VSGLESAAFTQSSLQFEDAFRFLPGEAIDIDRHQHLRRNAPALHDAQY
jgi:hypothetical protein